MSLQFLRPDSLPELLKYLAEDRGPRWFLAGGTDINMQIRSGVIDAGRVYGIGHLTELRGIETDDRWWRLGALTTIADVLGHRGLRENLEYLPGSLEDFAAPALRSMATLGGNIANASPTADTVPVLLVLEAEIEMTSHRGTRRAPLGEFFTGYKSTLLQGDEIITAIRIPCDAARGFDTYYRKVGSRRTLTIAKISLAGLKRLSGNGIADVRVAVGSLNEYPRRLQALEELIRGTQLAELDPALVETTARGAITPISDFRSDGAYRERVCLNLIQEFLGTARP